MADFDLQKAINGHPLLTHEDIPVTEFKWFQSARMGAAAVNKSLYLVDIQGNGGVWGGAWHGFHLKLAPVKHERWINVYPNGRVGMAYRKKESADEGAEEDRVGCIRIEWEE